jgi:hypothetical protein
MEKRKAYERMEWVGKGVRIKLDVPADLRFNIFRKVLFEKACGRLAKKAEKVLLGTAEVKHFIMPQTWYIWGVEENYEFVIYATDFRPEDAVELPGLIDGVTDFALNTTSFGVNSLEWITVIKDLIE